MNHVRGQILQRFKHILALQDFFSGNLNPVIIGATVSLVVTLVVSRYTVVTPEEAENLRKLHETPTEERGEKRVRNSLLAPATLITTGLVMPFLMLNYYVRPFQAARGELLPDGSLDLTAHPVDRFGDT